MHIQTNEVINQQEQLPTHQQIQHVQQRCSQTQLVGCLHQRCWTYGGATHSIKHQSNNDGTLRPARGAWLGHYCQMAFVLPRSGLLHHRYNCSPTATNTPCACTLEPTGSAGASMRGLLRTSVCLACRTIGIRHKQRVPTANILRVSSWDTTTLLQRCWLLSAHALVRTLASTCLNMASGTGGCRQHLHCPLRQLP